jgi:hypothetical protein
MNANPKSWSLSPDIFSDDGFDNNCFLVYSSQDIFIYVPLALLRYILVGGYAPSICDTLPNPCNLKVDLNAFTFGQLELECRRGVMYSVTGGRICASKEEDDNLPAYVNYNSKQPLLLPLFFESHDSA